MNAIQKVSRETPWGDTLLPGGAGEDLTKSRGEEKLERKIEVRSWLREQ